MNDQTQTLATGPVAIGLSDYIKLSHAFGSTLWYDIYEQYIWMVFFFRRDAMRRDANNACRKVTYLIFHFAVLLNRPYGFHLITLIWYCHLRANSGGKVAISTHRLIPEHEWIEEKPTTLNARNGAFQFKFYKLITVTIYLAPIVFFQQTTLNSTTLICHRLLLLNVPCLRAFLLFYFIAAVLKRSTRGKTFIALTSNR